MSSPIEQYRTGRVLCRFSCGAASAVATKLAIAKYPHAEVYNVDPGSEHPDNERMRTDCEKWFGRPIHILRSTEYKNVEEVFAKKRFLVSHRGAPCTGEMKRKPGDAIRQIGDVEVYGYTVEERHRLKRWQEENFDRIIECPLIERGLTKDDCLGWLDRVGIKLPAMYLLGFSNNNCIGCVKARDNLNYWKRVRLHFPKVFAARAQIERELGVAINRVTRGGVRREVYLDELEPGDPKGVDRKISCGLFCMSDEEAQHFDL